MTTSLNHLVDIVAKGGAAVAVIP
ncbi:MAG: hypothetical protein HW374_811, partial [Bacteroidetes bacterium]|nr:hypothetical protein [Bacteroidota bacterium]